jgi:hypothetical protein
MSREKDLCEDSDDNVIVIVIIRLPASAVRATTKETRWEPVLRCSSRILLGSEA